MQLETAEHLPTVDKSLTLVTAVDCQQVSFASSSENTAMIGMLLAIRHVSMNAEQGNPRNVATNGIARYTSGSTTASRMRLSNVGSRPYDRIATFADVLDANGTCFCIIFQNHAESFEFFQPCIKTLEGVGEVFVLEEPDPVSHYLGTTQSVRILDRCDRALPLLPAVIRDIPDVALTSPPIGHTRYFCQHAINDIAISRLYVQSSACGGTFCDRQQELSNNQKCGCFFASKQGNVVLCMDVTLKVPPSFSVTGSRTIHRFRSWRTSQLFVKPETWKVLIASLESSNGREHRALIRRAAKSVVNYVNQNGGWTCIGWIRTGGVQDESDNTGATIANIEQDPHITYLFPSNATEIMQSSEFDKLRYDHTQTSAENKHS